MRSPTAETIFSKWPGVEALSAGLDDDAATPVCADLIEWADIIVAMEERHRKKLNDKFGAALKGKRIVVLGILDKYDYMQPQLVRLLKTKVPRYLNI